MKNFKKITSSIKAGFFIGISFLLTCLMGLSVFSYVNGLGGKLNGDLLKSSDWNSLVSNVDELKNITLIPVPVGGVMAFNLTSCPSGWLPANGENGRPDLRGKFIRGLNSFENGANELVGDESDEDGNARILGSYQGDAIRNITAGGFMTRPTSTGALNIGKLSSTAGGSSFAINMDGQPKDYPKQFDASNVVPVGLDNRPKNIALIYCIKE